MDVGVRTTDPTPASTTGREPAAAAASEALALESVLAMALRRLAEQTAAERAACWLRLEDGPTSVVEARPEGEVATPPAAETFGALFAALSEARDLGRPGLSREALVAVRDARFSAAAPVRIGGSQTGALVLLAGPADPPGRVRPRTLAALAAAAQRLEAPIVASLAARRLSRLDAGVRRLDRLAGLGELVAEIVHEVRNPLVSVKTFLELLPERLHDADFRNSFFAVVTEEVQRIERLLDLVLEQAAPTPTRPRSGRQAPATEALESVARLLAHRASTTGVSLSTQVPPELPAVALGADGLRQVLVNLVMNALDVTPSGGSVELSARSLGSAVEIRVADCGPGVAPELRARLFEPFFSTKGDRPGGLGLAISRRIVEEASGTIAVLDRPGGGAVFRLRLPAARVG